MAVGELVNIHFFDDQAYETYLVFVHSKRLAEQLLEFYAQYWCEAIERSYYNPTQCLSFSRWVMDFCGCECKRVDCIQFEISEEMFD